MFRKEEAGALDSTQLRRAMDAATVKLITNGGYQHLEDRMYDAHGYDFGVASFSCGERCCPASGLQCAKTPPTVPV